MSTEALEREERLSPNQIHDRMMYWLAEGRRLPFIPNPDMMYTFFRAAVHDEQPDNLYSIYASTALTSGGAVLPRDDDIDVPFAVGFHNNEQYSVRLMQAVIDGNPDLISELTHVNPIFVGKVPIYHYEMYGEVTVTDRYWRQDEYLQYWFGVITGLEASRVEGEDELDHWQRTYEVVRTLFRVHSELCEDDITLMNDKTAPPEARAAAYQHFTEVFTALANEMREQGAVTLKPVEYLIGLIDNRRSLGGRSEEQLGELLGTKALQLILSSDRWSDTPVGDIAEDLAHHGAAFAVPKGQIRLALAHKLGIAIEPAALTDEDRHILATEPERHRSAKESSLRDALRPAIQGNGEAIILEAMTALAMEVDRDQRSKFHPLMIEEVLRPGSVNLDDRLDFSEDPHDREQIVRNAIYYLRNPTASSR